MKLYGLISSTLATTPSSVRALEVSNSPASEWRADTTPGWNRIATTVASITGAQDRMEDLPDVDTIVSVNVLRHCYGSLWVSPPQRPTML
jgi:hypothetical protein